MNVRDMFLHNPDLMADLRRVVGTQRLGVENSAFMAPSHQQRSLLQQGGPVPSAFQSTATHFSPIVVNANGHHPQLGGKPQIRAGEGGSYGPEKERKVAKKMRELKKGLLKTRPTQLNIAQDVEKDALLQDQRVLAGHLPNHHLPHHNNLHQHHLHQPHLTQGQQGQAMVNGQVSPGHMPGQLPGQLPGQMPSQGGGAGAGLFPFQVQLQHDPRTGLFQLIPISVQQTGQTQQQAVVQQPVVHHQPTYGPAHTPNSAPNAHSTPNHTSGVSEAQEMANQIQRESEQRRRYLKHTEEELRARVKGDNVDHQRSRSSTSSSSRSSQGPKVKSRSRDKDGHHRGRSHTVASSDLKDDLARATNNVRSRAKEHKHSYSSTSGTNLKKSNSEENILDKMQKPSRPRSHRSEEARTRLKRAKSGSSLDYRNMDAKPKDPHVGESNSHHYPHRQQRPSNRGDAGHHQGGHPLSKSQPHLDLDLPQDDVRRARGDAAPRAPRSARSNPGHDPDLRSPLGDVAGSPPPSPSLSKDSGVSGLNMKSSGELTLMERLLNSDTIRHQQRLSKVICLLRDEFAFDGYMENGVEDFAMGELGVSVCLIEGGNRSGGVGGLSHVYMSPYTALH